MVDAGNGGVSDNKTLHYTGSNPVLTTVMFVNLVVSTGYEPVCISLRGIYNNKNWIEYLFNNK